MRSDGPAASKESRLPRPALGSSDIAQSGNRTSSASTIFCRSCRAGRPRRRARPGGRNARAMVNPPKEGNMPMTMEKAQVTLPSDREVKVVRSFRAPRPLVYRTYTEPSLVQRWLLGPPGWSMPDCEMDVRAGGSYRWRWRNDEDGSEFGFFGTFREVKPQSRLVHTQTFDPGDIGNEHPMSESLVTVTFAEEGGLTTVTTLIDFGSKEARDGAVATGMTDGMESSYQLLDQLLTEQPSA